MKKRKKRAAKAEPFWIEAWALMHPAHNRPMVAIDNANKIKAWGIFRERAEAESLAKRTHRDCTVRRVFITDALNLPHCGRSGA